jgi:ribose transport system substrate-binding protein
MIRHLLAMLRAGGGFLVVIILAASLVSCTTTMDLASSSAQPKTIALVMREGQGDYWNTVKMGAEAAAKEFNVQLSVSAPRSEQDIEGQIDLIKEALHQGKVEALVLAASESDKMSAAIERSGSLHTPIISIDSQLKSSRVKSFIGANHVDAGKKAGEKLVELTGETAHIAIIGFIQGVSNTDLREEGLLNVIKQHPDMQVVAREYVISDHNLAADLAHKIISEHPEIDGIVALNEASCLGVAQEIQRLGLAGRVKVIGFDNSVEGLEYLQDGVIQATIIQNPFSMGYLGIKYAAEAIDGKRIPELVDTGTKIIDLENMFWSENQKLLFPFIK